MYLIVGLGNPGKAYDGTRHNIGFAFVEELARKYGFEFRKKEKFKGKLAEGTIGGQPVILLMPLTFMNLSGESVAAVFRYRGVELPHLLIAVDDIAIPLGQLRLRPQGSSGGHNGLESIEEHLTTQYARLRIGVGDREEGDLTDYVLGQFSQEEKKLLPEVLERAVRAVEIWLEEGINRAMDFANGPQRSDDPSNPSKEKKQ